MDSQDGRRLLELPTEILTSILLELDILGEQWDLATVCLVCRELRDIAQPILFRSFSIPQSEDSAQSALYRIEAFAVALLNRPSLQTSVRSIDMNGPNEYSIYHKKLERTGIRYTQSLLQAVDKVPFDSKAQWRNSLQDARRSFVVSLLVAITPGLVDLSMDCLDEDIKHLVKWMQVHARDFRSPWSKPFTSLKKLEISFEDTNMADMMILLQIPTLNEFSGVHCVGTYRAHGHMGVEEAALPDPIYVQTLELSLAHMDVEFITVLLSGCRNLRRLKYELMDSTFISLLAEKDHKTQQFTVQQLVTALATYTPQLEEVDLAFMLCVEVEAWEPNTLRGLERLTNLRKLTADYITMTGLESLPPQLQEITIRRCEFEMFDSRGACDLFRQLVDGKRNGARKLERVAVSVDDKSDMFRFFGLDREIDEETALLAAVYLQQKRFEHEGLELQLQTKDYSGVEDTEFNKLLAKSLDLVDMAECEEPLTLGGIMWDEWK